jgi:2-polyprenyl-3-methyl-5-hydroxy-6-metoxy-1,4-benzoquinol methylase
VVAIEVIEHVDDGKSLLMEVRRIIRKRAPLILSTPNRSHLTNYLRHAILKEPLPLVYPNDSFHVHEYSYSEIIKLVKSVGFAIKKEMGQVITFPFWSKLAWAASRLRAKLIYRFIVKSGMLLPRFAHTLILVCYKD